MQNFGTINETFKNILADGISVKNGKNKRIFNRYVKALKENETLKNQYLIYKNLENKICDDKLKSIEYIKESISLLKKIGKNNIINENSKLIKFLSKNGYDLTEADYKFKELHNNIDKLIMVEKTTKTLDSIMESIYFINDFILENKLINEDVNDSLVYSNKAVGNIVIEKFNNKYNDLDENEKKILNTVITNDSSSKVEFYNSMLKECVDLVNTSLKECTIEEKEKLLQVKDKLLRMEYNENEFVSEMIKIIKLKKII